MADWNEDEVRAQFPALAIRDEGRARLYFDAPAGSQVPQRVLDRMHEALVSSCANDGAHFRTSQGTRRIVEEGLKAAADFLNAGSDEIVFGLNTTSLLFHFSQMLARDWQPRDEILLTRMDHDGNIAPWLIAAEARGVTVRWLDFDPETFGYRYDTLDELVGPRTRLVACNHASNLLGTINDVTRIVAAGRAVGAVTMVDAVQSAPHLPIDVKHIGCDLLACSPYKFFGPHAGLLYLRAEVRDRLKPLKVRPSSWNMPTRFSPGTPSFEAIAGTAGAIEHLAWLGDRFGGMAGGTLRARIVAGLDAASRHETALMRRLFDGFAELPGLRLFGPGSNRILERVPTLSFLLPGKNARATAEHLAHRNIFAWSGSFYALEAAQRLKIESEGVTRIGLAHYNTAAEIDAFLSALAELV